MHIPPHFDCTIPTPQYDVHGVQQSPSCLQLDQVSFKKLNQTFNKSKTRAVFSARPKKLFQKFTKGNRLRHNKSTSCSSTTVSPMLVCRMLNVPSAALRIVIRQQHRATLLFQQPVDICMNIPHLPQAILHKIIHIADDTPPSAKLINMQRTISAFGTITNGALIITIRCS